MIHSSSVAMVKANFIHLGEWAIALHGRLLVPFWEMAVGHALPIAHYSFIE